MNITLKFSLIVVSLIVFLYVLNTVYKRSLNIRYSIFWIVWSFVVLLIALFPNLVVKLTNVLGIAVASNAVFLIMIFILYCMSFFIFLVITKHTNEITVLNYEISLLKKEMEKLKKHEL